MGSLSTGTPSAVPFVPHAPDVGLPAEAGPIDWTPFGPLAPHLARGGVTDLFVNGAELWSDGDDGVQRLGGWPADERATRDLAVRLIGLGGRHIDEATPCVDVRLAGGIRVHAVLPPISTTGTLLSIRVPRHERFTIDGLVASGSVTTAQAAILRSAVTQRLNLLVTGAAGAGKTTLLAALLSESSPDERVVLIEDVAELRIDHPHVVGLQARQSNLEGAGSVGLPQLVREALRMRPDRLVLGECRGAEVRDLLSALNTGHDGGAGTLHANSLVDVPARLEAVGALAGMSDRSIARQAVSAIGLVVHVARVGGTRRVSGFGRFRADDRSRLTLDVLRMPDASR
ncbi:TadA family conjugal transfer-associated ATPase [Diaminobutyricibacter tongyongensis]|uniref:TadA family conjugal transfer-associated ATPase n=1 Tax=Leifsonia tongyongensis TaxID=1268043 RepID=A0A6L9XZP1_9MICO|nr:TadA family conjugal transfer-associated ATPase [Diaminobutyricibacter tongyongensis]NEN06902.1 TadA family conjugal transfer-associated ATPase [Diaminobutyricibacter tongyongensis]